MKTIITVLTTAMLAVGAAGAITSASTSALAAPQGSDEAAGYVLSHQAAGSKCGIEVAIRRVANQRGALVGVDVRLAGERDPSLGVNSYEECVIPVAGVPDGSGLLAIVRKRRVEVARFGDSGDVRPAGEHNPAVGLQRHIGDGSG